MNWYVLFTKPRNEFKVSESLTKIGIKNYCPFRTEKRNWSDRVKKINIPLLPSMVLVYINQDSRSCVFKVPGVIKYLYFNKKPAIVNDNEILLLNKIEKGESFKLSNNKFKIGDYINVPNLKGIKGIISKIDNKYLWINLYEIGASLKLVI